MYTAFATNSKKLVYITQSPNLPNTVLHRSNLIKKRTDRAKMHSKKKLAGRLPPPPWPTGPCA